MGLSYPGNEVAYLRACYTSKGNPVTFGGPFGGSLSEDDDDGSKNVAKK